MATSKQLQATLDWVTRLALLTTGGKTPATGKQLGFYAMQLVEDLPPAAFCEASLKAIAQETEFFPAYKILKDALAAWLAQRQPASRVATLAPWLVNKVLDECANDPGPMLRDWLESKGVDVDAVITDRLRRNFAKADWSDPAKVRATVANLQQNASPAFRLLLGKMLGGLVKRHAPENLGLVPPAFHPEDAIMRRGDL